MCAPMFPTLLAESAQSVIQVKPAGSALMRIGSALSGRRPGIQGLCRAQEEKKNTVKHSWDLKKQPEMQPDTQKNIFIQA